MSMRITIKNEEPGFSDARAFVKAPNQEKITLHGGESITLVAHPNQVGQIVVQAARREGDNKE